jgi:hypothetical protein
MGDWGATDLTRSWSAKIKLEVAPEGRRPVRNDSNDENPCSAPALQGVTRELPFAFAHPLAKARAPTPSEGPQSLCLQLLMQELGIALPVKRGGRPWSQAML